MTSFLYPKTLHRRRQHPGPYRAYRRYKPALRVEFERKCVYCRLPDGVKGEAAFGVDHYEPQSKAPQRASEYENLFYACNDCNRRKGDFWPDPPQQQKGIFIPNPCQHVMFKHLRYVGAKVDPRSRAGTFTVDLLQLNENSLVEYRQSLVRVIELIERERRDVQAALDKIDRALASPTNDSQRMKRLWDRRKEVDARLDEVKSDLARYMGDL